MDGPANLTDELLRRALEFALIAAAQAQRVRPGVLTPPTALKPYLRFQKVPGSALPAVRKAVEEDDTFRTLLGSVATEDVVGAIGVLWLKRPEGWEEEASRLATEELAAQERTAADRQERSALKRLEAAEQSAARARADLLVAGEELAREREKRVRAEAKVQEATAKAEALQASLTASAAEARKARDQATSARAALDDTATRLRDAVSAQEELKRRLDDALAARVTAEARAAGGGGGGGGGRGDSAAVLAAAASLREAAGAMAQVAGALGETARALTSDQGGSGSSGARPGSAKERTTRAKRVPLSIPGGLYGDMPEVASHLLRIPDIFVLVDGYNVAKTGWPDLDLAAQRERLLDTLEDLVRRTAARIQVVFDGAAVAAPATGRRLVQVRFSPPGVIADDVIREVVAELPADQAVLVITSDAAVVASVRAAGANTISSAQFLASLAR